MVRASVALVDEHPLFLAGLSSLLTVTGGYSVVATGRSFADAKEILREHKPDILITEITQPGDAFGTLRDMPAISRRTKIVVCTARTDVDGAVRALDAGASGYVLKGSSELDLMAALDAVSRGETFINQGFAAKIIGSMRESAMLKAAAEKEKLTLREQQIVQHLLQGHTNREIAQNLAISEKTVKHYMTIIMQKLHARNRLEVVIAAQGLPGQGATRYTQ